MRITLPDGSVREFSPESPGSPGSPGSGPVTPARVAADIGPGLAKAAIGARVDGQLWDLNRPITHDAKLAIITKPKLDKTNRTKGEPNADALYILRHSTAHVMAEAVCNLYPKTQLAYGPPIDSGFYYDLALDTPISTDDFPKIEAEMARIIAENRPFTRFELPPDQGVERLKSEGNKYKVDNAAKAIEGGASVLSWYATGEPKKNWEDLCMGPHVPSTGTIGAFKLLNVASSNWHGDVNSDRFQRIYGTAFFTKEDLDAYLAQIEQAKQRDHRTLGQRLGLFTIDEQVGQGLILWKPRGATVRMILQDFLQTEMLKRGYHMVFTPHLGKIDLYKTSGHYPYYSDSQFPTIKMKDHPASQAAVKAGGKPDEEEYLLKPMNCPHHIKIYASDPHSYRDLPVRLGEFGTVYRFEQSGELTGMTRVRGFTQDDAHIFCTADQVKEEFRATIELTQLVFTTFGFNDVQIRLSLRTPAGQPGSDKYVGDPENWDRAERELREVLREMNINHVEAVGEAAFYGPKTDFIVRDVIGRKWQLGTVQLDYNLPQRFKLEYIGPDNQPHQPVMIHRAPFGSMERFMGILIEHFAGAFPLWIAPEQIRVLPISDKFNEYGKKVLTALTDAGFRATLDDSGERVQAKIKVAQELKIPYMLVVGGRDETAGTVAVRCQHRGDLGAIPLAGFVEQAKTEAASRGKTVVMAK